MVAINFMNPKLLKTFIRNITDFVIYKNGSNNLKRL